MKTLVLSSQDILRCFDANSLRECMSEALSLFSQDQMKNAPRNVVAVESGKAVGFMVAHGVSSRPMLGHKAVSVFSNNRINGRNPHQGIVTLLNHETGGVKAILEGSTITALRTAAVSAAATEVLSRPDSEVLGLVGSGRQAFEHAMAISKIRPIKKIKVWARSEGSFISLAAQLRAVSNFEIEEANTPRDAVEKADVIVTCTPSSVPLIDINEIPMGAHVNAIGSSRPGQFEISLRDRLGLKIYLDSRSACSAEASEIVTPLTLGYLTEGTILGEIGQVIANNIDGRRSPSEITLFKSVGLGIEDVFAADLFFKQGIALGFGINVDLQGL